MPQVNYPYLDLTVLPEIRAHVIAPHAAVLFDPDLVRVLWANGEGGKLIGTPALRAALESRFVANPGMMRQISTAVEKLEHTEISTAAMRVRTGFKTRLLAFTARKIELPDGESAVLLVTDSLHGLSHTEADMAEVAVNSLDGYTHACAIVDNEGSILSASGHFEELRVTPQDLAQLVSEVATEADRLVKRPVETNRGMLPAGIARISDDGSRHILIIAEGTEDDLAANKQAMRTSDSVIAAVMGRSKGPTPEKEDDAQAEEAPVDDIPDTPTIGAFSNKRSGTSAGRWYYKSAVKGEPAAEEKSDEISSPAAESVTESDAEADEARDATPDHETLATGGLVQEIDHTPLSESADDDGEAEKSDRVDADQAPAPVSSFADNADGQSEDDFRFVADAKPVRFVWEMDSNNEFRSVSPEFAAAVGPISADLVGLTWSEAATLRRINDADEIEKLLKKGDTWSGKTVLWPVENTDLLVPIDMAGLPSYGRNRSFEGFNGFGIVRTADAVVDSEETGLHLQDEDEFATDTEPAYEKIVQEDHAQSSDQHRDDNDVGDEEDTGPIGFLSKSRGTSKDTANRVLSSDEQETFEKIGDKLSDDQAPIDVEKAEEKRGEHKSVKPTDETEPIVPSAFAVQPKVEAPKKPVAKNIRVIGKTKKVEPTKSAKAKKPARIVKNAGAVSPTPVDVPKDVKTGSSTQQHDGASKKIGTPEHDVDTSILSRLPIPVLVYRENDLFFANNEFFKLTGYKSLRELADAGGVDVLFGSSTEMEENAQAQIFHKDGGKLDVHAHLQRVPWDDDRAMLLTLRKSPNNENTAGPNDSAARAPQGESGKERGDSPDNGGPTASGETQRQRPHLVSVTPPQGLSDETAGDAESSTEAFGGLGTEDLRSILDTATDGVIIFTDEGIVRAVNKSAEALFDIDSEDIIDQNFTRLLAPESHRSALDYVSGMAGTGVASILNDGREVIGKTTNGGLIPLFMTIGKLQKTDACCAVMRDITQWKRAEEELVTAKSQAEAASAQKTDFLAKVSHEIRTPLNAIIGFSDLMIEERFGKIDNDRYRGYLRDIHRSGNHVLELVNDLLDISKIESGKIDLDFDACDLNTTVSETVALTQPNANKERVIIRTSLSAVVPKVVADPRSLRQIILNLVSNSIKYTKSGGQVIVSTVYEESGEVVLRVRDTGVGMSELELAKALKPFQQVGGSSDTGQQGTGLGLPLTKAMVEANRAQFHIESKPDEGTLVEIHFPNQRVLADR